MNDLLERYLSAVCSYFIGSKRKAIYKDLKTQLQTSAKRYDNLEDLLIEYGHPRSLALSYGYRPLISHIYNPKVVNLIEKTVFSLLFTTIKLFTFFINTTNSFNSQ